LQQTESTQCALRQFDDVTQAAPFGEPHAPAPLHDDEPAHSFAGSWPLGTLLHDPMDPVTLHA
jgi:hypothetical protein